MLRSAVCMLLLVVPISALPADEPKQAMRPISEADSVIAVYRENWGRGSRGQPEVIFVAWPDGQLVWSSDRLNGGAPYRSGTVEPKRVASLLVRFEKDGLFANEKLNRSHFGPDSVFITILVKSGKQQAKMQSWHEPFEDSDTLVADDHGVRVLNGRKRFDVLEKSSGEYLLFRFVWSETRNRLSDLIPDEHTATDGKPFMKAGVLSWLEPATQPKPDDTR